MSNPNFDDIKRRMEIYKAEQESYIRSENLDDLNKRVINLQFANGRLYQELTAQRRLCDVLIARLNKYNEPTVVEGYTPEDLKMLKDMGISE